MSLDNLAIDQSLARAVLEGRTEEPMLSSVATHRAGVAERNACHGIAGRLVDKFDDQSGALTAAIRQLTLVNAMWELRHRQLVNAYFAALADARIFAILLKARRWPTIYPSPAARPRGDTDVLIAPHDFDRAPQALRCCRFELDGCNVEVADDVSLQEWTRLCDGTEHHIDLHRALLNAPSLRAMLPFDKRAADRVPLPRLGPDAYTMWRSRTVLHACIHGAMHFTSPYFVDGTEYYGGDRLIWLYNTRSLAAAPSGPQWSTFAALAEANAIAAVSLGGLDAAHRLIATPIPAAITGRLASAGTAEADTYFANSQFGRAGEDFKSTPGLRRKLNYIRTRAIPTVDFIRGKYPRLAARPLPLLYARRFVDLIRPRPQRREL